LAGSQLKTEVSLHYSSSGIKVDEIASRAGMGWVLTSGGVINRSIMGVADELADERYLPPYETGTFRQFFDAIKTMADNSNGNHGYDGQPDIFTYSFGGYSGKFLFDSLMNVVLIPHNNLKVEKNFSDSNCNFKITTPEGVKYYFGGTNATEKSKRGSTCGKNFDGYLPTAWYLTKVEHPYGDWISYAYTGLSFEYDNGRSQTNYASMTPGGEPTGEVGNGCFKEAGGIGPGGGCAITCQTPNATNCVNYVDVNSKLLLSIGTSKGILYFSYTSRNDCDDKLISHIDYYDRVRNSLMYSYYLTYAYYGSTNHIPYLTQLTKTSVEGAVGSNIHQFQYYSPGSRPARLSYSQDHWGFYNGIFNTTLLPPPQDTSIAWKFATCTANRSGNFEYAVMGMLSKVVYPTGGFDSLVYESNDPYDSAVNKTAGGVRVKRVITSDGKSTARVKRYYYCPLDSFNVSSGYFQGIAPYEKNFQTRYSCHPFCCEDFPGLTCPVSLGYCDHRAIYSNSLNNLFTFSSSPLSYASVIESDGENFENGGVQYKYLVGHDAAPQIILNDDIMGAPYSNFSYLNGSLTETNVFRKSGAVFTILKQTINHYKIDSSHSATVSGYVVNRKFSDENGMAVTTAPTAPASWEWESFDVVQYDMMSRWFYVDTTREIVYDMNGQNPVTNICTFNYNPQNLELSQNKTSNSKGDSLKTTFSYPGDYAGTAVYDSMFARHIISPVIEQKQYVNAVNNLTVKTTFRFSGSLNVPDSITKKTTGAAYTEGKFNLYDTKGNILQLTTKDGIPVSFVWGYNYLYPVAKIVGASFSTVVTKIDTASLQFIKDDSTLRSTLANLRTISGALVIIFTYKTSVGISSETDPNGRIRYYEYDSYNRLFVIRDFNKNIIKKYCYKYAGELEQCTLYYNTDTSNSYTRTCGTDSTGSSVLYSVPEGKYSSTVSQAAADQLAINDLIDNGQNYANQHGSCTLTCTSSNCIGANKKCINNVCETGIKVYTSSTQIHGSVYSCIYHYEWSDGSWSQNYTETHTGPCLIIDE